MFLGKGERRKKPYTYICHGLSKHYTHGQKLSSMPDCRFITPLLWEQIRSMLVGYFGRHVGSGTAEDLAQETLLALLTRSDYQIDGEQAFVRICYGFARNVLRTHHRRSLMQASVFADLHGLTPD